MLEFKLVKKIFFENKFFYVSDEVYEPAEDTFLIAENLDVRTNDEVLEIGTGCGILSVLAAQSAKRVVSVDINPYATKCAKINAISNQVQEKIDIICGDLFRPLKENGFFDLILFNAPYLPNEENNQKDWIEYAWNGGKNGRITINRFINSAIKYLKPRGRIFLVQSTLSNIEQTLNKLKEKHLKTKVIVERKLDFETIVLIESKTKTA
jgi:release factor glutamine methyltransferase